MTAKRKIAPENELTVTEFLAFYDTRPKEERWELIEGVPVMSASPVDFHQVIVANITAVLWHQKIAKDKSWFVMSGTGTKSRESVRSLLQPDVMVKQRPPSGVSVTDDCLVAFEVLSRSNSKTDQAWRQKFYAGVPNCAHYVTVAVKQRHVVLHSRTKDWEPVSFRTTRDVVPLTALGTTLALADIYRFTPHGR